MQDIQQIDPVVFTSCARCQDDIYEGYDYIHTDSYDFCSWHCLNEQMRIDKTAVEVVAGEY